MLLTKRGTWKGRVDMRVLHKFRWLLEVEFGLSDLVAVRCGREVDRGFSRTSWKDVTCKKCLRLKGQVDEDRLLREVIEDVLGNVVEVAVEAVG